MSNTLIELKEVNAKYGDLTALEKISFRIDANDFTGIIGPNGGGKTTLLLIILDLLKPSAGSISRNIRKHDIGYLPQISQFDNQFPISVESVVLSGLTRGLNLHREKTARSSEKVTHILSKVGISELRQRPIGELSGGELQRTMLARAIISSPKLLILDEPNTYVDNRFEQELYRILEDLNKDMAILLVSHDVGTISPYIKSIACVNKNLHFHPSNKISSEQLAIYNCPIELVTHGPVPHRVIQDHKQ